MPTDKDAAEPLWWEKVMPVCAFYRKMKENHHKSIKLRIIEMYPKKKSEHLLLFDTFVH